MRYERREIDVKIWHDSQGTRDPGSIDNTYVALQKSNEEKEKRKKSKKEV